jgi:ribonuclease BN (tRNA processing enzyme)
MLRSQGSIDIVENGDGPALELIILGAGPAYSDVPGSFGSAYLVRLGEAALLLDLGQGCFPALAALHEPSLLSGVFISHLHPDHFIDLVPLRHYLCRAEATHGTLLPLMAPNGLERRLDALYDQPGFTAAAFEQQPLAAGQRTIGPFALEIMPVRHYGESCAVRVKAQEAPGRGLVYTGDIADTDDVRPLIRAGDVLLSEATMGPGPVPDGVPHLDGPAVGRLASDTHASHVVVTHIRMGYERGATIASVRGAFHGPVSLANPGARYLI